ncbi:protein kinase [Gemmata sp. JC673]|uniref:Protein kinase n=1 Tax=Gemmata algarum TaxID=2975278 RepID=A0ABU5EWC4_9BACT|nr:HD domain-containing phosphohydrolase [Gemmata algarum]MDY3559264.1 protein kinase [Gemmata algarum]
MNQLRDGARSGPVGDARRAAPDPPQRAPVLELLASGVLLREEWDELPAEVRAELAGQTDTDAALAALMGRHLLTRFQADAVRAGNGASLLLGHYRLLEPLGQGGMGLVYRAEHRHLRRPVALKVLTERHAGDARLSNRFFLEARAVARLQHPNIVSCLDAGREGPLRPGGPAREYYVMDLVPGADLQATVAGGGPLPVHRAAGLCRQVAEALAEAHRHGLVHRDIKPPNILVTPDWKAKVLDFGLARHSAQELTEPGVLIGSVGYMAPEQVEYPSRVDGRADVFGLGASLFLALTGRDPFPAAGDLMAMVARRLHGTVPRVREHRPELPAELDALVAKLMDPDPERRFPSAGAAAAALLPFVSYRPPARAGAAGAPRPRVLVIDDDPDVRAYVRALLGEGYECVEAADGRDGLGRVEGERFDLLVVDQEMPRLDGSKFIARVQQIAAPPVPMILYMSGRVPTESLGGLLLGGADDFIRKPFTPPEFLSRVRGLLARRGEPGRQPSGGSSARALADVAADGAASTAIALLAQGACRLAEEVGAVDRGYHARIPQYVRALAAAVPHTGAYARLSHPVFVDLLAKAAPAHDVGMLAVPPDTLSKRGRLDETERLAVQAHPTVGGQLLARLAAAHPEAVGVAVAADIAKGHHERWDGTGYPDGLRGEQIPLAARIVALVSVYDALRCRRPYRPALSHPRAVRVITAESPGQFDPVLVGAFGPVADQFDRIFLAGGERP